jgi:hypothetical protein
MLTAIESLWPPLAKNRVGIPAIVTFVAASLANVGLTAPLIVLTAVYLLGIAATFGLSARALGPVNAPSAEHLGAGARSRSSDFSSRGRVPPSTSS